MTKSFTKSINSDSSVKTEKIAELIGNNLRGGEVIELVGDLGSGKTTFVRGLVKGTGSSDQVSSPSFTINKIYSSKSFNIYHFDFYRLNDPGIMKYELEDLLNDDNNVIVIEWAKIISKILPSDHIKIEFRTTDINSRQIKISSSQELEYLSRKT
jgi:tRNA threonylcarbamoyladenosine biosynthesis protein TsaE